MSRSEWTSLHELSTRITYCWTSFSISDRKLGPSGRSRQRGWRCIIGHTLLRVVRWCIRLTRLTLVCEVIRYRLHGQKFATGSWFDPDPRTRIHSCRGLRGRRHARTASFHHVHGQSRKRNEEFLFQGVDLEVFIFGIFFPSNPLRATSFFVCLRRLCLRRSPGVTQVLRLPLSLSLSHTHSLPLPSQIRAVSTFLLVWFVSKRVREARGFVESKHELQRYWINNKLSSLTIDASTCMAIRKDSDWSEKSFPRQTNFEILAFFEKEVYFQDSWRLPWAG